MIRKRYKYNLKIANNWVDAETQDSAPEEYRKNNWGVAISLLFV